MIRNALLVLFVLALAGCGFHLRDNLALPQDTPPVHVVSTIPFSELVTTLERNLRNAGARVATREQMAAEPTARVARLDILSERWGDLPIAIDDQGRAQEFSLRYATIFTFRLPDGTELVPQQVVELSRDYVSPPEDATGTSTEREILADELRREMAASILRRIDSVVRSNVAPAASRAAPPGRASGFRSGPGPLMEVRPDQLAAQGAGQPLQAVYLVAGPETLHVLEAADAVRARARAEGAEREVFDADGRDPDWDALSASFNAPSLFSSRRLLELRLPGGKPGKAGAEVIAGFCEDPPADVTLLIVAGDWSKAHHGKWVDAVSRRGVVSIAWAVKPHELPGWIDRRLRERGLRATSEAVQGLAERVEGNLLAAAQEIDKLALLAPEGTLDLEAMQSLVADAARYDVFRLIESTLSGQPAQVRRMLAGLRAEGEQVAGLMPMVTREVLRAAALARAQARGANLAAEMKSQGLWESRQAPFKRALQRHATPLRWNRFAAYASRIDRAAKGRGPGEPWQLLERLLLAIAEQAPATRLLAGSAR